MILAAWRPDKVKCLIIIWMCYSDRGERLKPVIVHRAVLGSVERMIAILCESFGGKWFVIY